MKTIARASGVTFIVADDVEIVARRAAKRVTAAVKASAERDRIARALANADYEIVDRIHVKRAAARKFKRTALRTREPTRVEVPVARSQSAVLLLEQEGTYRFVLPTRKERAATRRASVVFDIVDEAWGGLRTYVLRFAADAVIKKGVAYLERDVRPGLVDMSASDPARWKQVDKLDYLALPEDRPARILLFVHGTFSSTVGGFAALGASPWGNDFRSAARKQYDAVIGFDHPTLSVDPGINAQALHLALAKRKWPMPPTVDIVAHSRGGLVVRSLIEELLPASKLKLDIGKVAFVACTHEGTLLAAPDNWKDLVDLYTNLVAAGCRILDWFGHAKVAATVIEATVKTLGLFVKLLAVSAIANKRAPGLAAMEPDSAFVDALNKPKRISAQYYVVQSDFSTALLGKQGPDEFSPRFKLWLADGFVDRLMKKAANDLVVDVRSMTARGVALGKLIKAKHDFGRNALVYHTNYFARPETTHALGEWLGLLLPPKVARAARSRRATKTKRLPTTKDLVKRIEQTRTKR